MSSLFQKQAAAARSAAECEAFDARRPRMSQKTALIMAGGTGGHIFPGLAVAEELRARGWRVHWLGAPGSMESRIVPQHGFALELIDFSGVRGKGLVTLALLPLRLLRAFWQALQVVRRVKPDVVVGLGGYITFPGGMMARAVRASRWCCTSRTRWPAWPTRCWRAWPTGCSPPSPTCSRRPSGWATRCARRSRARRHRQSVLRAAPARCGCWWWAVAWAPGRSTRSCPRRWP